MADDVAITAGSGTSIAADDCTSGYVQLFKLAYGANGDRTQVAADADGLLVNLGANNDVTSTGSIAHDGVDSGNPVKVGYKAIAHGTNPTAVAAADRTDGFANRAGIPFVIGGHMNTITVGMRTTASTTDIALSPGTVASGLKVVITRLTVNISNACTVNVGVKIGFGATTLPADNTTGVAGVLVDNDGFPPGGGVNVGDGSGIIGVGADGEELRITSDTPTGGSIHVSYSYFTIES